MGEAESIGYRLEHGHCANVRCVWCVCVCKRAKVKVQDVERWMGNGSKEAKVRKAEIELTALFLLLLPSCLRWQNRRATDSNFGLWSVGENVQDEAEQRTMDPVARLIMVEHKHVPSRF